MAVKRFISKLFNKYKKSKKIEKKISKLSDRLNDLENSYADLVDQVHIQKRHIKYTRNVNDANKKIRIAFVVQHASIWPTWRSVWEACKNNSDITVDVILAPYFHINASTSVTYDDMHRFLLSEEIPFYSSQFYDLDAFMPQVVFLQGPYEETRPKQFQIEELVRRDIKIAYIPYGLEMGGGCWNIESQFNMPVHQNAWRIFVRSKRHQRMYAKYCQAGSGHVVVTGHPKFDGLKAASNLKSNAKLVQKIKGRKVLLWTPHFGVGMPPTWSTFRIYGELILNYIRKRTDLFLLVRPHPLFFDAMKYHNVWNADDESQFISMIEESDNFALDQSEDPRNSFKLADALMTDVGSFLLEYLPTEKPILYLHHPNGLGMNDDRDLVDYIYSASNVDQIHSFIQMIADGNDDKKEMRKRAVDEFLFGLNSNIGVTITDHIVAEYKAGDDSSPYLYVASDLQQKSDTYWVGAETTYLAPKDYYDKREEILVSTINELPQFDNVVDIGCGDGRYTKLFAKSANNVTAYDISPILIDQAIASAKEEGIQNIDFVTSELDLIKPLNKYSMVICMGVTSCIIDDVKFIRILEKFKSLVRPGGCLLTIDTLSTGLEQSASDENGYVAKYRSIKDYCELIGRRNFKLDQEILIKDIPDRELTNKLFIFSYTGK